MTGSTRASGIDAVFAARETERKAPSAVWATFDRDGVTHRGASGTLDGRRPGPDTAYRIASCTKSFTATALLALRDAGEVDLDAPVTDWVPAFREVALPTADSPVPTIRMLATMSAGFPTDDPWGDRQESLTDAGLDAVLRRGLTFDSVPGTTFAYSNLGYALLGRVIAEAAGRAYREVIERDVLEPLGLASTGFTTDVDAAGGLAVGHRRVGDGWEPLPFSGPGAFSSIGGLFSTTDDLARWARWLGSAFDPEAEGDHEGVLSRASRREMQQIQRFVPGLGAHPGGYGLGLFVEHHPDHGAIVSHSGGYPGFSAHMRWHAATGVGAIGFENATYAQVSVPVTLALDGLLAETASSRVATAPWPETLAARDAVEGLVLGDDEPGDWLAENIELDVPLGRRRRQWAEAVAAVGGIARIDAAGDAPAEDRGGARGTVADAPVDESKAPSHLVWRRAGRRGLLRFEIRLTPESPPRVQTLTVRAETAH
ncbi:serine hydrolase [Frigoribacterium sp. Leaf172]|uniref:serine hydrolase domain-containing protein n=1 Tax=Frigoribacterium sp. Leaf172 TaxID=1736285 RepID=UPI0006FB46D1|nr:serine hydrolase domain-containing protein [Frigoribacterium sp. Leaf172]KQR64994.1 hypothetical protein ASF89_11460 [Frigoribacterium sp. Leaf172]